MKKCLETGVGKPPAKAQATPCFHSRELFCGHREVCIEHAGQQYRLRITRQNKLILTK
jgi:hemin uptake protein HemP